MMGFMTTTNTTDLMMRVQTARNLAEIAIAIRAFGTKTCAGLSHVYSAAQVVDMIKDYEIQAANVERCTSTAEARRYLRDKGWFGNIAMGQASS